MDDHYAALNVPRDADADAIKRAYRLAIWSAHPDRGGDKDSAAGITVAYSVLSDPDRRAHYDKTGEDEPAGSEAEGRLAALLSEMIENIAQLRGDAIGAARKVVHAMVASSEQTIREAKALRDATARARGRFKRAAGHNMIEAMVEDKIKKLDGMIESAERSLQTEREMLELLSEYRDAAAEAAAEAYARRRAEEQAILESLRGTSTPSGRSWI